MKWRPAYYIRKVHQGRQTKPLEFAFETINSRILEQHKRINSSKDDSLVEEVWQRPKNPRRSYFESCAISDMNGVDVTRNIKNLQKQGSYKQQSKLETIQSTCHNDMRETNLSKDIEQVGLPFTSVKKWCRNYR